MIKLIRARIENYRQLRSVQLEFARTEETPLTVIRAENGTGKTTLLTALTWGLFGDDGLPGKRSTFRLHPLDWDAAEDGAVCEIEVSIEFATIDDESGMERTYNLVRTSKERPSVAGAFSVDESDLMLFESTANGDKPVPNPTAFLQNRVLPKSLRDVFFIDGDRALTFIETADERSAKRDRVERAVRQLLGLDILEEAEKHLLVARKQAVNNASRDAAGTDVEDYVARETALRNELQDLEEEKKGIESDRQATDARKRKAEEALREALAAGGADRQALEESYGARTCELENQQSHYTALVQRQRAHVNSADVLFGIGNVHVVEAGQLLANLEAEGVIPDTLPEVVRDRLSREKCICGRDVSEGTDGHAVLCELLGEIDRLEESHEILLHLSSTVRLRQSGRPEDDSQAWLTQARDALADVVRCHQTQRRLEKEITELRTKIDNIPDTDIAELSRMLAEEETEARSLTSKAAIVGQKIQTKQEQVEQVVKQRQSAQKKEQRYRQRLAEEIAAIDLLDVIRGTVATLESETVAEVSEAMSSIFLEMIVADPDTGGLIKRAELTREHDIIVVGSDDQRLDPDKDLSGAQRRALTLSFILGLVRVSGVKAPNVVDTPLGMTSALVRRSLLEYAARNSTQLVMFLTGSEIHGVEDILDQYAGRTYTMTFTDHYPKQLVNDPGSERLETLLCECDYRSSCQICQRKASA